MATVLLQASGAALGGVFGPFGAMLGGAVGALAGRVVDQSLFGQDKTVSAPVLQGARITSADEGSPVTRLYGTMRISGNLIWATRFEEENTTERRGGKSSGRSRTSVEKRSYYANFAIGLCEGKINNIKRIWADGKEVDLSQMNIRVYHGGYDQLPDPLIEAKQGIGNTPAYRGLAYVVFDHLPIDVYGKRIPVLQFEVTKVVAPLENEIEAVTLIAGTSKHGFATVQISEAPNVGEQRLVNRNVSFAQTDLQASLDELQGLCPQLKSISLVVPWFGSDLRAGSCIFRPGVEARSRQGESRNWRVGSQERTNAYLISRTDNVANFGETPDDASVLDAIKEIKSRGLNVTIYPRILMDIPANNTLSSPYGPGAQSAFPSSGRITCNPAIGKSRTADKTALAARQIARLMGTSRASDFSLSGERVSWLSRRVNSRQTYRHMILHYAHLARAAKNSGALVNGFIIGSAMVGLTSVRNHQNQFPFVRALGELARDVATVLGPSTAITYAADWREYSGYQPQDNSDSLFFHLDELWAHRSITSVGINNYMPLSDWRDDDLNTENPDGFKIQHDVSALQKQITSGEGFDYYYASRNARIHRLRTPIKDALGKAWAIGFKDLLSWWKNTHYNRIAGVEFARPTGWKPQSKPVWFTELGCPAMDKGATQADAFLHPKSAENASPHFSNKSRDDQAQRAFLQAHLNHWKSNANPGGMVDTSHCYIWTWDARPHPAFPAKKNIWPDGQDWRTGHWINGRLGNAPLADLISAILTDHGFSDFDVTGVEGVVAGFIQNDVRSARSLLEPLLELFQINVREGQKNLIFSSSMRMSKSPIIIDSLIDEKDQSLMSHRRVQESELVNEVQIKHIAPELEYLPATAYSRRLARGSQRQEQLSLPISLNSETANMVANQWLQDHWASREVVEFSLPMSMMGLELGDRIKLSPTLDTSHVNVPDIEYSIVQIEDGIKRQLTGKRIASASFVSEITDLPDRNNIDVSFGFFPSVVLLDLPVLSGAEPSNWARGAAYAKPWIPINLLSSVGDHGYTTRTILTSPATIGYLGEPLSKGVEGRFDYKNKLVIDLPFGEFSSISITQILAGENVIAVQSKNKNFEIIQFQNAKEISPRQWQLSKLLRAQSGTDDAMLAGAEVGAGAILINDAVANLGLNTSEIDALLNWRVSGPGKSGTHIAPIRFSGGVRANTPLSPVHLRARRDRNTILLNWIRRGRYNADSWKGRDIPLDEDQLIFRVDIYKGTKIIRSVEVNEMRYLYLDEIADFKTRQSSITFAVTQIGGQIASGISRKSSVFL